MALLTETFRLLVDATEDKTITVTFTNSSRSSRLVVLMIVKSADDKATSKKTLKRFCASSATIELRAGHKLFGRLQLGKDVTYELEK